MNIRSGQGFTLIELLVVITILAILAGATLPYVQSYVEESRISKAKSDLEEIGKALAIYESRERTYIASDVSLLTGRYLNKSPIDPWGRSYIVATHAGTVYTSGPDRNPNTQEDNLFYPYQPLLALVRAKWIDNNKNGRVDGGPGGDYLQFAFSRKLNLTSSTLTDPTNFLFSFPEDPAVVFDWTKIATSPDAQSLFLPMMANTENVFTGGSDTVMVTDGNSLFDTNTFQANRCIASQSVIIKGE
ncbi:MAG TPA: prepilin-type N-terminal cleavage/methylation domain-containing protein [Candidatus Ozemobacteraceae bacterium]|nr:prepilin-type N-terminal cleavage/methylation domain-containing protein [Candidatus Ozemobacteraceae bacterium]